MAVVRVRGEQLNITDVAAVLASDPAATEALAETFFPLTGGVIRGETILCYQEPCIWSWDPFLPCQDNLWRHVVKAPGNLTFSVNDISQSHLIINKIPGPPGVNAFVIVGNHTVRYSAGHSFVVCGTPPNDGVYKVVSGGSIFGGGNTTIPVVQQIPNISVPFGTVADFEFETEMLLMGLVPVPRVAVPTGVRLFADGGLEVNSFFDVFVDIDMGSNKITNLANGTVSGDALHFGQIGTNIQAFDSDLTAVAGLSSFGIAVRTATNTWATRTLVSTSGNITFVNPAGLAGDPNFDLLSVGTPVVSSFVKITTDSKGRVSATTPVVAGDITTLVDTTYLNVTGDAMTAGFLTLFQDPTAALHAATKGYVDTTTVASAGDTMTGNLVITGFKVTGLANGTLSGDALHFGQIGTQIQAWDTDLDGLAAVSSTGL
ncbi:MAG: hypothetical protein ACREAU_08695, partial [Nitrosopumilaceae archaeon]